MPNCKNCHGQPMAIDNGRWHCESCDRVQPARRYYCLSCKSSKQQGDMSALDDQLCYDCEVMHSAIEVAEAGRWDDERALSQGLA